jgi:hypothetical protein
MKIKTAMTLVVTCWLLAACGDGSGPVYSTEQEMYAPGCHYSANLNALDTYCYK